MSSTKPPNTLTDLSGNGVSRVWRDRDVIYKQQPKFLTDNEIWCLKTMYPSGYVPKSWRESTEVIGMEYIEPQMVTDKDEFLSHTDIVIEALNVAEIRHGDLTIYSVIPHGNKPYLIDFAESRLFCDPRPDKRPMGDRYYLTETMVHYVMPHEIPHS